MGTTLLEIIEKVFISSYFSITQGFFSQRIGCLTCHVVVLKVHNFSTLFHFEETKKVTNCHGCFRN